MEKPLKFLRGVISMINATLLEWRRDKAPRMAAAIAFYAMLSMAPLLVIVTAAAGFIFHREEVHDSILKLVADNMGDKAVEMVRVIMEGMERTESGIISTVVGLGVLLVGASRVFLHLQDALDTIWDVPPKAGMGLKIGLKAWGRKQIVSVTMIFATGGLIMSSLVLTTVLSTMTTYFTSWVPGFAKVWIVLNFGINFLITSLVFAMIFKFVPATKVTWGDVWVGALLTTIMFSIGRGLLALYLGWAFFASAYGAAWSLVVILLWAYFSAEILLMGAEFTAVYAKRLGSKSGRSKRSVEAVEPDVQHAEV